jgi:hypothetical protein
MNAGDYLENLRGQLKGFLPEQQEEILDEVASHLESGADDETRGSDPMIRQEDVLAEMGTPGEMGGGFQAVYRPNRWLDFLLIFVPVYLVYPLLNFLYNLFSDGSIYHSESRFYAFSLRAVIVLGVVMVIVAIQRRSLLLFAFWIPDVICRLVVLISRESPETFTPGVDLLSALEMWFAYILTFGLAYWLARNVWRHRSNLLIVLFALQPIIGTVFGYITSGYILAQGITPNYPNWSVAGIQVQSMMELISLAGFVLLRSRNMRWAALLLGMGNYSAMMVYAYWPNPLLISLWALFGAVLLIFWNIDLRRRVNLVA